MRRALLLTAATAFAILISGTAYADEPDSAPPADAVPVDVVTVNGSGCPAGTAHVTMSGDNTSFEVNYDQFAALSGGNARPVDARKNCQLNLRIDAPAGYRYAIADADYSGWAHIADGANGLLRTNYYFQGSPATISVNHRFAGPFDGNWERVNSDVTLAAPCDAQRNLNINTELRLTRGSDPWAISALKMDTSTNDINTRFHLKWRRC
jgi:hypothetical protein